ncbi:MAG: hypothetical protein F6K23_10600 [Okeania sp. SIO2C9]|uniref:hypothetical protein n=1 Tax=Okeania sp. SIO2C9 TaxID=2607791 RepID=UPI0013C24919|nr:hypothetical protein [Okeania sp. SIO2C9]NEQ73477.1 hypothetical protein [Okeania sp. SIO2C9]
MLKKITASVSLAAIALATVSISAIAQDTPLEVGTVQELITGDLKSGTEYNVGANFDICADQDYYLNKKVRLTYEEVNINDCESIEPCGKTRKERIVSKMKVIE